MMGARLLLVLMLAAWLPQAVGATLDLAWWKDGRISAQQLSDNGGTRQAAFDGSRMVPLGSVWKLFVYVYASDSKLAMPEYACKGHHPDEVYCCEPGRSIGRDAALAQSCGPFFAPARLGLGSRPWRAYWSERLGRAPDGEFDWLADPAALTPRRAVRLDSLLRALASIPAASRADAESALLHVVLSGRGADTVRWFGSGLRVKTFSWHEPARPKEKLGGAAGWLADGTPVWFAGADSSSAIFQKWAPRLAQALPAASATGDPGCVLVDYFARYPIRRVLADGGTAPAGILNGRYRVEFENGKNLIVHSQGELLLWPGEGARPRLRGRLGINDYVARVIDREAGTAKPEAAKALAVAARTYLQQNAVRAEGCQQIADSSAAQRVSPNPSSEGARAIARWTDQLVLAGPSVRYHADREGPNMLSWRAAQLQADQGRRFDEILAAAYPSAELSTLGGGFGMRCERLAAAEAWLARELPRWERVLRAQAGYETPREPPMICELAGGAPYSEQSRNRIFVRGLATREDRITLAHEFLHLGLRAHPRGQDESTIEQLARRLTDLTLEAPR